MPAIRRGFLVATPVGLALLADLELKSTTAGAIATAALICGFLAFDAPARVRVRWQLMCAPVVGLAAAVGVVSSASDWGAIVAMAVVAAISAYLVAVSLRLAVAGLTVTLAVVISQGLFVDTGDWPLALLFGTLGGLAQALTAAIAWLVVDREREQGSFSERLRGARERLRGAWNRRSPAMRHAIRFSVAMAIGVAIYRLTDFYEHGYWVPLTILFVLKPESDQTIERIAMRAAGTLFGLLLATGLAELLVNDLIPTTIVLMTAAALAYALLAIEYALFTTAITVYVVLLTDTLGAGPLDAAGERGLGTLLGIVVAGVAFKVFGELTEREEARQGA